MKSSKRPLLLGFLAVGTATCALVFKDHAPPKVTPAIRAPSAGAAQSSKPAETAPVLAPAPESAPVAETAPEPAPLPGPEKIKRPAKQKMIFTLGASVAPIDNMPLGNDKAPLVDPTAREALSLVGADPDAENYWLAAINDPNLPDEERQDLIEDLNQEGLSDPQNPTLDDLPLIVSRLALIEEVGADAMDQTNAEAFEEAYKDLLELAAVASQNAPR